MRQLLLLVLLTAAATAEPVRLGVSVEIVQDGPEGGLRVTAVEPGTLAATIGMAVEDRLLAIDQVSIASGVDLAQALAQLVPGQPVTIQVQRKADTLSLLGQVPLPPPDAATLEAQAKTLTQRLDALDDRPLPTEAATLRDLLLVLERVQAQVPVAAAEFKKVYPHGRFKVSIAIDIDSDVAAPDAELTVPEPASEAQP